MILGPISFLDCAVFLIFLIPQLLLQVGLTDSLKCLLQTLPFLVFRMPFEFIHERYFTPRHKQSPFAQQAPIFSDIVIRCVRFAFANIPASIGAVFFSKWVALPFARFRMLRHGHFACPIPYQEVHEPRFDGLWMIADPEQEPDVVVYYSHGGGFSMGSSFFYIEFMMAWLSLLKSRSGWNNPAVLAVEYTLVPEETYPVQLIQTVAAYEYAISRTKDKDPSRICVAGDSAGATLQLSMLLSLAKSGSITSRRPGYATMISPWCVLVSEQNRDTPSDYLNADSLHLYAREYVGQVVPAGDLLSYQSGNVAIDDPIASPGSCTDLQLWKDASPQFGFHFIYGSEEVFRPEIQNVIARLRQADCKITESEEAAGIHAWPVVALFLSESREERLSGLNQMVDAMSRSMRAGLKE